jgi:hypothetical protein
MRRQAEQLTVFIRGPNVGCPILNLAFGRPLDDLMRDAELA